MLCYLPIYTKTEIKYKKIKNPDIWVLEIRVLKFGIKGMAKTAKPCYLHQNIYVADCGSMPLLDQVFCSVRSVSLNRHFLVESAVLNAVCYNSLFVGPSSLNVYFFSLNRFFVECFYDRSLVIVKDAIY